MLEDNVVQCQCFGFEDSDFGALYSLFAGELSRVCSSFKLTANHFVSSNKAYVCEVKPEDGPGVKVCGVSA